MSKCIFNLRESKAIGIVYQKLNRSLDNIKDDVFHGYLSVVSDKDGNDYIWFLNKNKEMCMAMDSLEVLSSQEILKTFL